MSLRRWISDTNLLAIPFLLVGIPITIFVFLLVELDDRQRRKEFARFE